MFDTTKNDRVKFNNNNNANTLFNDYPDLLSIEDMQEALGIGRSMAYRLISEEKIKHLRIGKVIKVPKIYMLDFVLSSCYPENG